MKNTEAARIIQKRLEEKGIYRDYKNILSDLDCSLDNNVRPTDITTFTKIYEAEEAMQN